MKRAKQPEWRRDPISGTHVIIAPERAGRPIQTSRPVEVFAESTAECPFCPGNESMTPPEVSTIHKSLNKKDLSAWQLRVFPNKYPALKTGARPFIDEDYPASSSGVGIHEVIVETPNHHHPFIKFSADEIVQVLLLYRDRMRALKPDTAINYVQVFKNHGHRSGASIAHAHSQLLALPIIPPFIEEELRGSRAYFQKTGNCIFCEMIKTETRLKKRLIHETTQAVALAPFASKYAYEIWILPKKHLSAFESISQREARGVAELLCSCLRRLGAVLSDPSLNMYLHTSPFNEDAKMFYHWHLEISSRLSEVAGFERGTGLYINSVKPEDAALKLRKAAIDI